MLASKLRKKYIQFYKEKGHVLIPSYSIVPEHDPSTLFISAGMHPLVPYFLGQPHPQGKRLVDYQKCVRTTDIDEVGDRTHLTWFEMLGNWSLNDYWKKEAITWSYEFLTSRKWLGFNPDILSVTVFAGDEDAETDTEAAEIWMSLGIPEERIYFLPKDDNWWGPAGTTGPCGPCTEMFIRRDDVPLCGLSCRPNCECGAWTEIWNDVFIQYIKTSEGKFEPMDRHIVDTGLGLARTAAMLQDVPTVYDTEIFQPIMIRINQLTGKEEYTELEVKLTRIVADHVRSAVMIMSDDAKIAPSNVEAGYIVRRLIRKAIHCADKLGISSGFMQEIAEITIDMYKDLYPEVVRNREFIFHNLEQEEKKFRNTLSKALRKFDRIFEEAGTITGKDAFLLFTSFGLPHEMTRELAEERGMRIDMDEFQKEFEKHREISRTATEVKFRGGLADHSEEITMLHTATHLLQAALRKVLGDEVTQNGSNITKERLRFDFTFSRKLTPEEIQGVEDLVNGVIAKDLEVSQTFMPYEEAISMGALAFFKETYGDTVSVYSVGDFSMELCGGPHVERTGALGRLKITKQKKIGAGIVRIRAVLES